MQYGMFAAQVCASTACFGIVSEISHEQLFTAACLLLRAIMGESLGCPLWLAQNLCQSL